MNISLQIRFILVLVGAISQFVTLHFGFHGPKDSVAIMLGGCVGCLCYPVAFMSTSSNSKWENIAPILTGLALIAGIMAYEGQLPVFSKHVLFVALVVLVLTLMKLSELVIKKLFTKERKVEG